jgi:radical SAM/Cys-rich protein
MQTMPQRDHTSFERRVAQVDPAALRASAVTDLMLNVGLRCDLACAHCHHDSSPGRTECMDRGTMRAAVALAGLLRPRLTDITGGAPELYPHLRELISGLRDAGLAVRVRTNLVCLERADGLAEFLAAQRVGLMASLPGTDAAGVGPQRGNQYFEVATRVLARLARLGYGSGSGLSLDIAYNPPLGELPQRHAELEAEFFRALGPLGVRFDRLLVIANMPLGRFGRRLAETRDGTYATSLRGAFNPATLPELACRSGITVAWDGTLWDCDFNLAAKIPLAEGPRDVSAALEAPWGLVPRRIAFGPHCWACAAGAGSS